MGIAEIYGTKGTQLRYKKDFSVKRNLWSQRLQRFIRNLPQSVVGSQIMLGEALFIFYHDCDDLKDIKAPDTQIQAETICHDTIVRRKER